MGTKTGDTSIDLAALCSLSGFVVLLLTLFFMPVSTAQTSPASNCIQKHAPCFQNIQMMSEQGFTNCSIKSAVMKCWVEAMEDCAPTFGPFMKSYQDLVEEGCQPNSNLFNDIKSLHNCLQTSDKEMPRCTLNGEFETLREVCSSFENAISCRIMETETICGEHYGKVNQKLLEPIVNLLRVCQNERAAPELLTPECGKRIFRCSRGILTAKSYTCSDIEQMANCYYQALRTCNSYPEALTPLLQNYMRQIPEYCNPESQFRKNWEKSYVCLMTNQRAPVHCYKIYAEKMQSLAQNDFYKPPEKMAVDSLSLNLNQLECLSRQLSLDCGRESEYVFRYMFLPVGELIQDACMKISGENCNSPFGQSNSYYFGSSCGLKSSLTTLILCFVYALY